MGSLRNPVGPLPSSIYWRRRAVLLSVLALLALLIAWIVSTGGGGGRNGADGTNDKNPSPSTITPGPTGSGPAISQAPGGRDESTAGGDSSGSGSGSGSDDGSGSSSGSGSGSGSGGGSGSGSGAGGSDGAASGGTGSGVGQGDTVPAGSTLPNCTAGAVKLTVRSLHNGYGPGETPTLLVTAENSSKSDCKVDLGPKSAVLTITQAAEDDEYWSSADCPKSAGSLVFRAPAGSDITYTVKWDRKPSAPKCATPPAGSAGAGTYLVELKAPGYAKVQTSFVLESD
ncbi:MULTISPECIES: hypothetical protein [unclassified Streptomyces]|uniref:hypothetical protein n=1 Tax=unclassified Streptomyces TaxID=2593676 RepID=UPI0036E46C72